MISVIFFPGEESLDFSWTCMESHKISQTPMCLGQKRQDRHSVSHSIPSNLDGFWWCWWSKINILISYCFKSKKFLKVCMEKKNYTKTLINSFFVYLTNAENLRMKTISSLSVVIYINISGNSFHTWQHFTKISISRSFSVFFSTSFLQKATTRFHSSTSLQEKKKKNLRWNICTICKNLGINEAWEIIDISNS